MPTDGRPHKLKDHQYKGSFLGIQLVRPEDQIIMVL